MNTYKGMVGEAEWRGWRRNENLTGKNWRRETIGIRAGYNEL